MKKKTRKYRRGKGGLARLVQSVSSGIQGRNHGHPWKGYVGTQGGEDLVTNTARRTIRLGVWVIQKQVVPADASGEGF